MIIRNCEQFMTLSADFYRMKERMKVEPLASSNIFFCPKVEILTGKYLVGIDSEDGTKYSPEEYDILKSTGQPIPLQVHIIKKMFDGLLVSAGNRS